MNLFVKHSDLIYWFYTFSVVTCLLFCRSRFPTQQPIRAILKYPLYKFFFFSKYELVSGCGSYGTILKI